MQISPPSWSGGLLSFRFAIGRRLVTVEIPPVFTLLFVLTALLSYSVGYGMGGAKQTTREATLAELRESNEALRQTVAQKESEREQMAQLAQARSEELWKELGERDREQARLWRILGSEESSGSGRSSLASRGAVPRKALAVKAQFGQLQSEFAQSRQDLERLISAANLKRRAQLSALRARQSKSVPSLAPCKGEMTSGFGNRLHPLLGISKPHRGCDFTAPYGTEIFATAQGTVVSSDWLGGYGQAVEIDHGKGLKTLYAHCDELKVKKGQTVRQGQLIATVGTTGMSSGPHCHYEVHQHGKPVDPSDFLPRLGRR